MRARNRWPRRWRARRGCRFHSSSPLTTRARLSRVRHSIWERIHGETLGLYRPDPDAAQDTWRAVGRQLARLHTTVTACADPNGWLDRTAHPDYEQLRALAVASAPRLGADGAEIVEWVETIEAALSAKAARCFLHYDVHDMNLMCGRDGSLMAIIDWGDAGWGDPALELSEVPVRAIPYVLDAYRREAAPTAWRRAGSTHPCRSTVVWPGGFAGPRPIQPQRRRAPQLCLAPPAALALRRT